MGISEIRREEIESDDSSGISEIVTIRISIHSLFTAAEPYLFCDSNAKFVV